MAQWLGSSMLPQDPDLDQVKEGSLVAASGQLWAWESSSIT